MKKIHKLLILCTGILLAACGGENTTPVEPVTPKPEPETRTLTFVLPQEGPKTAWEAGDKIVVHGEYAADQVTVTLSAGDIASGGKTARKEVSGLYPYQSDECGSTLYASWPAEASENLKHCFFYSGFSHVNSPLMAACNKDDTFTFYEFTSRITFSVSGGFDSYVLNGRKDAPVGYEFFQVKITDKEVNLNQYRERPLVNVGGELSGAGTYTIYVPGPIDLPKGYVLQFIKDGKAIKAVTDKSAYAAPQGGVLDLGDVTERLEDFAVEIDTGSARDLSTGGTANCYPVVDGAGVYKFQSVKGNTSESVGYVETVKVLWETWNNTEEVTKKSIIKAVMYENGYIFFEIPAVYHAGNALVAALDEDDNILWSWHIWVPETPFTDIEGTDYSATKVMSRNVGALKDATAGSVAPVESYGLLYQFGRKDPFPGAVTVAGTAITKVEGMVSVEESVKNPTVLYYTPGKDWQDGGEAVAKVLWENSNKKTLHDPCPPGYKMPQRTKSYQTWSGTDMYGQSPSPLDESLGLFTIGAQVFPLAGYISDSDGEYKGPGTDILLWSEHYDSGTNNGYGFRAPIISEKKDESGAVVEVVIKYRNQGNIRSMAGSARCVKL